MIWNISFVIESDESGFHAFCPFLKGLHAAGDTKEEALMHLGDALSAYMQSVIKHDDLTLGWDNAEWFYLRDVLAHIEKHEL